VKPWLKRLACLVGLFLASPVEGQVRISEFLALNARTLADEDGDFSDWIEIENAGEQAVNLEGWSLSDAVTDPVKWRFPATFLAARTRLLVFASEKDRAEVGLPLHTNFRLAGEGEFLGLYDPNTNLVSGYSPAYPRQFRDVSYGVGGGAQAVPWVGPDTPARVLVPDNASVDSLWFAPDFDDRAWIRGFSAVGFETAPENYAGLIRTDVGAAMANRRTSVYVRVPFVVNQLGEMTHWQFRIQYDDGFVAWLNGQEIARRNAPNTLAWNSVATASHPDEQAVVPEDLPLSAFQDWLVAGTNWLAIQGLNTSTGSSDLLVIPVIESERPLAQPAVSQYFFAPTPGAPNRSGTTSIGPLLSNARHAPTQPAPGNPLAVQVEAQLALTPVASVQLHYRVGFGAEATILMEDDGAHQDGAAGDGVFGAIIPLPASTPGSLLRYRVTALDEGGASSRLPPFLDSTDSEEYFGTVVHDPGIESRLPVLHWFVQNPAAAETRTGTRCTLFYQGELYDNVEIRVHGQSTAGFTKKGFNLDFPQDHRFRPETNLARVKDLKLLTNWGDKSRVRNTLAYEMIREAGSVGHFAFPVRVQRNAQFHAILDLMEDADDRWMARVGRDPAGALYKIYNSLNSASGNEKKTRKDESFSDLQSLIDNLSETRSLASRVLYAYDHLDLPQTVSYFVSLSLISSQDHGHKNYFMYRDTNRSREWAIFPWDVDLSWGRNWTDAGGYFTDTLYQNNSLTFYNQAQQAKSSNRLYNLIFNHPDFRRMVLRRLRTVMDSVLQSAATPADQLKIEARIRYWVDRMDPLELATSDADLDYAKWGSWGNRNATRPEAQRIIDIHLPGRRDFLFNQSAAAIMTERIPETQPASAGVTFGDLEFNPSSGKQSEEYVALANAEPYAVDLSGWQLSGAVRFTFKPGTVLPASQTLYVSPEVSAFRSRSTGPRGGQGHYVQGPYRGRLSAWGDTLTLTDPSGRVVAQQSYAGAPSLAQQHLRISEFLFEPASRAGDRFDARDYEFVELRNVGAVVLSLAGVQFSEGIRFAFSNQPPALLAPGQFVVIARNADAFAERYGTNLAVAGTFTGQLDNAGETLHLEDASGETILRFRYDPAWLTAAPARGYSLVATDETRRWSDWHLAAQWRPSLQPGGSPGQADPALPADDADGDGLPDAWEGLHGLDPTQPDADQDPDGDGADNRAEYVAGTNPRDRASVLRLSWVASAPPLLKLRFEASAGRSYQIEHQAGVDGRPWQVLASFPDIRTNTWCEIEDSLAPQATRFYRLRVQLTP
jgi:hypothetical protein